MVVTVGMPKNPISHHFKAGSPAIGTVKINEFKDMAEFMFKDNLQRLQGMMGHNP